MGDKTAIAWTDSTWNPIRGCSRVSAGCDNCYAQDVANRFSGPGLAYEGLVHIAKNDGRALGWNGQIKFVEKHLLDPLKWKPIHTGIKNGEGVLREKTGRDGLVTVWRERPRRIFVNSMSDLFHENVADEMRDRIFAVMALAPQHIFQVLTKRPERMLAYGQRMQRSCVTRLSHAINRNTELIQAADAPRRPNPSWPLPNVWLGVSVENQKAADERGPAVKKLAEMGWHTFFSAEPLLGDIDVRPYLSHLQVVREHNTTGKVISYRTKGARWLIAGGESGRNARPMHPEWARSLRDQCAAASVPFFFKQWGAYADATDDDALKAKGTCDQIITVAGEVLGAGYRAGRKIAGMVEGDWRERGAAWMSCVGAKAAGHLLDGVEHHAFPAVQP